MRMREKVMKARWALLRRESSGVAAVMRPQAEADSRMTFSPPILHGGREGSEGELCGWAAGRTRRPYRGGTRGGSRHRPSLGAAVWGGRCSHIPSAEEAEAERAGYSRVPLSPWAPELPPWVPVAPQGTKHPRRAERRPQPTPAQPSGLPAPVLLWAGPPPIPFLGATSPSPAAREGLPVPQVAAHHLSQAVAPEEAAEHNTGLLLIPAEVLAHGGGTDGHADAGAV